MSPGCPVGSKFSPKSLVRSMRKQLLPLLREKLAALFFGASGMMTAVTAISILALLALMALVADLGHLYAVKAELQNAADAGAHAGAWRLYYGTSGLAPASPDCDTARSTASTTAEANKVEGKTLTIPSGDVQIGIWNWSTRAFEASACSAGINAVKVVTRKDEVANGPVNLAFAGIPPFDLTARATAILDGVGKVPEGGGTFALAIKKSKVPPLGGELTITLSPDHSESGGWHSFFDSSTSANDLKKLVNGSTPSPEIKVGDSINLTNGVVASVFQEMEKEWKSHNSDWTILCPVIADDSSTGQAQVLGFAAFKVTGVSASPEKFVKGKAVSNYVAGGTGGGGANFGTLSCSPKLVE
jgi:Flp pilus assembly protein TadG